MRGLLFTIALVLSALVAVVAESGPICFFSGIQTFSDEMEVMDAVVIADLMELLPAKVNDNGKDLPKAKFKVVQVVKGESLVKLNQVIETIDIGEAKTGSLFLIMGDDSTSCIWGPPVKLSDRGRDYVSQLLALPKEGSKRLEFFQQYLEDSDAMLARDAHNEFDKAPYKVLQDLKPKMQHDDLVALIKNPETSRIRRRLYLQMLGICGGAQDLAMLEEFLRSNDPKLKAGLDALIACYLTLKGPEGLTLIEELYLRTSLEQSSQSDIMKMKQTGFPRNV
jgi:hypothetical protein